MVMADNPKTNENENKKGGLNIAVRCSGRDLLNRYGKARGTQLSKDQASFVQELEVVAPPVEKIEIDVIDMKLFGDLCASMVDNDFLFKELPPEMHMNMKMMKQVNALFMSPEAFQALKNGKKGKMQVQKVYGFNLEEFEQCLKELEKSPEVQKDADKRNAVRILRDNVKNGETLDQKELKCVYDMLLQNLNVKLSEELLNNLLVALIKQGIIDANDAEDIKKKYRAGEIKTLADLQKHIRTKLQDDNGRIGTRNTIKPNYAVVKMEGTICSIVDKKKLEQDDTDKNQREKVKLMALTNDLYLSPENHQKITSGKSVKPSEAHKKELATFKETADSLKQKKDPSVLKTQADLDKAAKGEALDENNLGQMNQSLGQNVVLPKETTRKIVQELAAQSVMSRNEADELEKRLANKGWLLRNLSQAILAQVVDGELTTADANKNKELDVNKIKATGDLAAAANGSENFKKQLDERQKDALQVCAYEHNLHTTPDEHFSALKAGKKGKLEKMAQVKEFKKEDLDRLLAKMKKDPDNEAQKHRVTALKSCDDNLKKETAMTPKELQQVYESLLRDISVSPDQQKEVMGTMVRRGYLTENQKEAVLKRTSDKPRNIREMSDVVVEEQKRTPPPPPPPPPAPKVEKKQKQGFFRNVPDDQLEQQDWRNTRITEDKARAQASGGTRLQREHFIITKDEHPAMQMLNEYAQQAFNIETFEVHGDMTTTKEDENLRTTMESVRDMKSVRACQSEMASVKSVRSVRALPAQTKKKYEDILKSVKDDQRDQGKKEAYQILNKALAENRTLSVDEMEKVLNAIGKENKIPKKLIPAMVQKLVNNKQITQAESKDIIKQIEDKAPGEDNVNLKDVQMVLGNYAEKKITASIKASSRGPLPKSIK